ncbi:ASCH domain-containing protein [Paracoccus sulfuroxidans]|uniref:ASCH domain-containing protein n=1 Tax=Paracoccus sulfuroxidans TaxID=384678 RepID=UPI001F54BFD3|nr:ASCH domain-containing protein [Paracoccus sulfuroxidans]
MAERLRHYPDAVRTRFGDGPELSARLLDLIRQGKKTGTCGALAHYEADGEPVPSKGDIVIAENWDGTPALVYEVTGVHICRFDEVTEAFALTEGEGDYDDWKRGHIDYFTRNGGYSPDLQIVCESFRVIEVLP